ncbi:glutamate-5-semialdehyde dehydrogenase [Rhodospirillum rubrum]|uniref:glutamate-5-semialdehyde dehydrogenase n=1 Tax=Rhodospirillum rubrum TaxID=1085 RepID=UPI001906BD7B|nr:glutamate-5-semialdehyde dehydrogenase [Rhodospirillum rubrum]MBK1665136.1 glutamate-5-semialdehyde dehydrogenase [Rhodospirillum rubrum]MBK1676381.1 glutamate-5-semialdehyde dehydrogenase [Rhodospirillum rubrum]
MNDAARLTTDDIPALMLDIGRRARAAGRILALAPAEARDAALLAGAAALRAEAGVIALENAKDMSAGRAKGLTDALLDRLELTPARIEAMAKGLEDIAALPDPVGTVLAGWQRPNGLRIERVRVPIGVIGVIYESRPNVTADAGALCLKAGNAAILRGGSESFNSSRAIHRCLAAGLRAAGLPEDAIQSVPTPDRAAVGMLLTMTDFIDVIVPRGGKSLIERVSAESKVPLFKHLEGLCHTYIHAKADPQKALSVTVNAKMRRTGVCGSTETILVDRAIAATILPPLLDALSKAGCALRGDDETRAFSERVGPATAEDWDTEYLDAIVSIRVVADIDEALAHIAAHSSDHTDCILTEDAAAAERFLTEVDSAIVMHNASTQFADGGEFGMGAEIGISTGRLHARGPVGVEQLTIFKYKVRGTGQTRP